MAIQKKEYLYKVASRQRQTITQLVRDGDFEGLANDTIDTYFEGVGTPSQAARTRLDAAGDINVTGKITLDGSTNYVQTPSIGGGGTYTSQLTTTTPTVVLEWYKDDWNDGASETLFYNEDNILGGVGIQLDLNVTTAGKLTGIMVVANAERTIDYNTSSITTGLHQIALGTDGRYVRLFIDGTQVAVYDYGSADFYTGQTSNLSSLGKYATGDVSGFAVYDGLKTSTELTTMWLTRNMDDTDLLGWWDFAELTGNIILPTPGLFISGKGGGTGAVTSTIIGTALWSNSDTYRQKSAMIITNTGGSATQGLQQQSGEECYVDGGIEYTAGAKVKAASGETIRMTLTPTGGGSAASVELLADGTWQHITQNYTTNASATRLAIKIEILSASASEKTFYIDKIALNAGSTAHDYFDQFDRPAGTSEYQFNPETNEHSVKQNVFTHIGTWNDVISDFKYQQEINSAGSAISIVLARSNGSYGEGVDIDYNLDVKIYEIDSNNPSGRIVFNGYISDYTVDETTERITVTLFSYGAELSNYIVETGEKTIGKMPLRNNNEQFNTNWGDVWINHSIRFANAVTVSKIKMKFGNDTDTIGNLTIYKGDPALNSGSVIASIAAHVIDPANTLQATATKQTETTNADSSRDIEWEFDNVELESGVDYYLDYTAYGAFNKVEVTGSGALSGDINAVDGYLPINRLYRGFTTANNTSFGMDLDSNIPQAYIEIISPNGNPTTNPYLSVDPAGIVRDIMDNFAEQGGNITYDESSIPLSNTTVSYTFKMISHLDAIKKLLELAPSDWYYYIDQATNKLYFKPKSSSPDHKFILTEHITSMKLEKRTRDIVNVIYFTGGELSDGTNLLKKYEDATSIAKYGRRLNNYSDNRVTLEATADTIANRIFAKRTYPEVRTKPQILSNYDIASVKVGDVVTFRGFSNQIEEESLWDVGQWDNMFWDIKGSNPNTFELQVARLSYAPDKVTIVLSTTPPDVNKRIEDINRNLNALLTINNPTKPS